MPTSALAHLTNNRERYLDEYKALLRIPSISTQPEHADDVRRAAEWIAADLRQRGMASVEIMSTPGHPVVYAESEPVPGKPVVLVYGHYDVQPVDPLDEWHTPPFEPAVQGDHIVARGASDMKGQLFALLKAVEALHATGPLPVQLKFMLEGEEEIGSPHLAAWIEENRERIACDFVLNCDAGINAPDRPSITYALRGLAYFELHIETAEKDLHSGMFGGGVRNPIHVISELIAGLHDTQGRVTLPGFYDDVRPLDQEERALLAKMPYDEAQWLNMAGAEEAFGEEGYTTLERISARPTLDVNGIWGGYIEKGAKTVLPARAAAKLSTRLVADQKPADIEAMLRAYLDTHVPGGVKYSLHCHSWGPGATMDRKSAYMQQAVSALESVWQTEVLFNRQGGSVPVVGLMQQKLGVDSIMLGFAMPDDGIHGPNERQYLPNIWRGMEVYVRFLAGL